MKLPFYFLVVFWGAKHRGYFVDYCLASMLAPGNIPALVDKAGSRFLICTTADDWRALQADPLFRRLAGLIAVELVEIDFPGPDENKMNVMSRGHKRLTEKAFSARAYGVNLNPDTLFCDGTIEQLQRLARAGKKLVFHAAVRFELEGVKAEMQAKGILKPGMRLAVRPRDGVDIALRHRHSELRACNFDAPFFWDFPVHTLLDVPGEHGIVIHCFSWAALLVSYGDVDDHDTSTFEDWTLDGDYIFRNFGDLDFDRDVHVVRDSDEIFVVSVTPRDEANVPDTPARIKSFRVIGEWFKGLLIDKVFLDDRIDPMKKLMFLEPVRMHSRDLSPAWRRAEERLHRILALNLSEPGVEWGGPRIKERLLAMRESYRPLPGSDGTATEVERRSRYYRWRRDFHRRLNKAIFRVPHYISRAVALAIFHGYHETIRRIVLVFAYGRVIILAMLGNKMEIERIKRRLKIIRESLSRGKQGAG